MTAVLGTSRNGSNPTEWPWQALATVVAALIAAAVAIVVALLQKKSHKDVDAKLTQLESERTELGGLRTALGPAPVPWTG